MPRTSASPAYRLNSLSNSSIPGRRSSWWSSPGRPYALGDFADRAAGLVQAFLPGQEGGRAIAGVLSGRINPGGKLPVQIPRNAGGQPATYLQPPLGSAESAGISGLETVPLYPFGFGSSYTTFEVDDLRLSSTEIPTDGEFTATVRVRNTGDRAGDEVVQLYLHDVIAQVARPVKLLTGFARVQLEPRAAVDVTFHVHADRTAYSGPDLRRIVEAGDLEVLVGTSSSDLPCREIVRLTGNTRVVGHDRRMITPVDLTPGQQEECEEVPRLRGRTTLATVAASAGVSVATVSKVLNGRSDVSESTRARVQEVLREHEYVGRRPEPVERPDGRAVLPRFPEQLLGRGDPGRRRGGPGRRCGCRREFQAARSRTHAARAGRSPGSGGWPRPGGGPRSASPVS